MILGALSIAEDERDLARRIIKQALESVRQGLSVYKPSGAYPEGPHYWKYGTTYTCLMIKSLKTALGTDFEISETPGLRETGLFWIYMMGPTGRLFNYADGPPDELPASAMFLFSHVYDQPTYAWWQRNQLNGDHGPKDRASFPCSQWKLPGMTHVENSQALMNFHVTLCSRAGRTSSRCVVNGTNRMLCL